MNKLNIFLCLSVLGGLEAVAAMPTVERNGQAVAVERFWQPEESFGYERIPAGYLRAEAGEDDVWTVSAPEAPGVWHVLPEKAVDLVESCAGSVRFRLTHPVEHPVHLAVLKGDERLAYLFMDPPAYLPRPGEALDVTTLGIFPDTGELLSPAINETLRTLSAKGGGTLYFPAGVYTISTILMQDNTELFLDDGAVLQASLDPDVYPLDDPELENTRLPRSLRPGHRRRLIFFDHVENAAIRGKGVLDAQGSEWRRKTMPGRRAFLNHIRMVGCRNIALEGIVLRDSEFWSTHILLSEDVRIDGVKIFNEIPPKGWDRFVKPTSQSVWNNADGINPDSSQCIRITHSFFHTGDDCVPIKNTSSYCGELRDVRDITVRSCMMVTPVTAMKLGTETLGKRMENILFEDIEVVYASRVFSADLKDGITASGITYRDIRVFACNRPFDLWIIPRQDEPNQQLFSNLRNVFFDTVNIRQYGVENNGGESSHIQGYDADHTVENVTFCNVTVGGRRITGTNIIPMENNEYIHNIEFQ